MPDESSCEVIAATLDLGLLHRLMQIQEADVEGQEVSD